MKKLSLSVLMLLLVLTAPAFCDGIVIHGAWGSMPWNPRYFETSACALCGSVYIDAEHGIWPDGKYYAEVEFTGYYPVGPLDSGIHVVDVYTHFSGQLPDPYVYNEPWTVETPAGGFYIFLDSGTETFYGIPNGVAVYNFVLHQDNSGNPVLEYWMSVTAPVPEPFSIILVSTGLVGILRRARIKLAR